MEYVNNLGIFNSQRINKMYDSYLMYDVIKGSVSTRLLFMGVSMTVSGCVNYTLNRMSPAYPRRLAHDIVCCVFGRMNSYYSAKASTKSPRNPFVFHKELESIDLDFAILNRMKCADYRFRDASMADYVSFLISGIIDAYVNPDYIESLYYANVFNYVSD